jgi:leucyl aminopeptidase
MLDVRFSASSLPASGALALLVAEGASPSGLWQAADTATGGAVTRGFASGDFTGKESSSCSILAPGGGLVRVVAAGIGKSGELTERRLEDAGGLLAAALARETTAAIATDGMTAAQVIHVALGAALRAYRFDIYRTKEKPEDKPKLTTLTILTTEAAAAEAAWAKSSALARGIFIARDLASEPPNILTPVEMANRIEKLSEHGLGIEILTPEDMEKLGFGALLGVAQGSANPARTAIMTWNGGKPGEAPLAFIGKGVTFDTGGISIKPAAGMEDMKWDMAGAAAVTGLMATLAIRKAPINAVGLVGLVENMPGGNAQRPSDVVKSYSGQTIEVLNTDAEGRLVLADVLWYCQERFAPRFMIDLATLTGAIIISLGHEHAGLFSNDDELAAKLTAAGLASGERLWRMPMGKDYDKQIKSDIADMKNIGGRPGGSITAAQFIQRFVNDKKWAHLDIAGTAWATKDHPTVPKGATGFGVRLLNRLVADHFEA